MLPPDFIALKMPRNPLGRAPDCRPAQLRSAVRAGFGHNRIAVGQGCDARPNAARDLWRSQKIARGRERSRFGLGSATGGQLPDFAQSQ